MESFNSHEKSLDQFDRPEDVLETPEESQIDKRERMFSKEGKFEEMLALKATLEVLQEKGLIRGNLGLPVHQFESLQQGLLDDPRKYAYAVLGVDQFVKPEQISDEEITKLRDEYLNGKGKKAVIEGVDEALIEVRKYQVGQHSDALNFVIRALEEIKKEANNNDWQNVITWQHTLQGYTSGMDSLLDLTLGNQSENDYVRNKYGLQTRQEVYDEGKR